MQLRKALPTLLAAAGLTTLALGSSAFAGNNFEPGRFTGGGRFASEAGVKMTHGFELYCDTAIGPNHLQVNWTGGNHWHLEELTRAECNLNNDPAPPVAPVSVYNGQGLGRLNGVSGYAARWRITDNGEPGTKDRMFITITGPDGLVIQTIDGNGSLLEQGNHQAHRLTGRAAR